MDLKKQLWMDFGIIFGCIAVASAALYFLESNLASQTAKIVAEKTAEAQQIAAVGILASLKDDAVQAAPYLTAMNQLLPTHDALIDFPQWMASVGQSNAVSVSVSFQGNAAPATATAPGTDPFSFSATGSAADLAAFLDDVEMKTPGFLVAIDSFDLLDIGPAYRLTGQGRVFSR